MRSAIVKSALFGIALAMAGMAQAELIGDVDEGARVFGRECASCHQIGADARHRMGPQLNRIFDARAANQEGYHYSPPLRRMGADGLVWKLDTLEAYIENPRSLVSGTRMNYRGLADPTDRANVLAFLRVHSDMPQNIPESSPTAIVSEVELAPEILALVGDPAYGEYLAQECLTCHQAQGTNEGIPAITGWPQDDFVVAMHAYRQGLRPHQVMQMMAQRLDDQQIASLAVYFESIGQ